MKTVVITLVVVVILGIAAFFVYRQTHPPTPVQPTGSDLPSAAAETNEPDQYVTEFYTWYFNGVTRNPGFDGTAEFNSKIKNWLTPSFVENLTTDDSGVNLFTQAQDVLPTWNSHIAATILSESATNATVSLTLGTGSDIQKLKVMLVKTNDKWRMQSVDLAQ